MSVSPLRLIATAECRSLWRDGRFLVGAAVLAATITLSTLTSLRAAARDATDRAAASSALLAQWRAQGDKNPHDAGHTGTIAFKPVSQLGFMDRGSDPVTGIVVPLQAHGPGEPEFAPAQDDSPLNRFGDLFAARVLQYLLPLLIIGCAFGTIASERDGGMLRLLLSTGVSSRQIIAGKTLGIAAALATILVPLAAIAGAAVALGAVTASGDDWRRLVGIVAVYAAYAFVFLAIAVGVSARARTARAALVTLLLLWGVSTVVAPAVAATAASATAEATGRALLHETTRKALMGGIDGHNPYDARAKAFTDSVLAAYRVKTVKELPVNIDGLLMQADEDYSAQIYERAYADLYATWDAQATRQLVMASLLSPTLPVSRLSAGIAGTDHQRYRGFLADAERYRGGLMRSLNLDMAASSKSGDWGYKASAPLWDKTGVAFRSPTPPLASALAAHGLPVLLLGAWTLVALVFLAGSAGHLGRRAA